MRIQHFLAATVSLVLIGFGEAWSGNSVGLSGIGGHVSALGDANNDKYCDVVVQESDQRHVSFWTWRHVRSNSFFAAWTRAYNGPFAFEEVDSTRITTQHNVTNTITGDLNFDGHLDLIVSTTNSTEFYLSGHQSPVADVAIVSETSLLAMNFDGNMYLDFLGHDGTDIVFWQNTLSAPYGTIGFKAAPMTGDDFSKEAGLEAHTRFLQPNSNSFLDLDGDCVADLFLTTTKSDGSGGAFWEFWINRKHGKFHLQYTLDVTHLYDQHRMSAIAFEDFNGDGSPDIIFSRCLQASATGPCSASQIHVLLNQHASDGSCSSAPFSFDLSTSSASSHHIVETNFPVGFQLPSHSAVTLHTGDYDHDGFPDILVPLQATDGTPHYSLWRNINGQGFDSPDTKLFDSMPSATSAAFFDVDDDGSLDILVNFGGDKAGVLLNSDEYDAFFLKTLGGNGVCATSCPSDTWHSKFPDPKPFGVSQPGVTFKVSYTDAAQNTHHRYGAQSYSSGALSLQTPYVSFGLGRVNNYVESFSFGMASNAAVSHHEWLVGIIPNSQLAVFPYPIDEPDSWQLVLFISPAQSLVWIILAWLLTMLACALALVWLYRKEHAEDEQSKHVAQDHLHFLTF